MALQENYEETLPAAGPEAIPDDERDDLERQRIALVEALGLQASKMVKEATDARARSGVDRRWEEDLSNYYGSDMDVVPPTLVDRVSRESKTEGELESKSAIGVNITRPKTNAAHARIVEMATPTEERNFAIKSTPIPSLASELANTATVLLQNGQPIQKEDGSPLTAADRARQIIEEADRAATLMQRQIDDQLTECDFTGELRAALGDMVRLGTGVLCGPLPKRVKRKHWTRDPETGAWMLIVKSELVPWTERIAPYDFFPDPAGAAR